MSRESINAPVNTALKKWMEENKIVMTPSDMVHAINAARRSGVSVEEYLGYKERITK